MVVVPTKVAGWMYYRLDNLTGARGAYTLAWRLKDVGDDPWTVRFSPFKGGQTRCIRAASATLQAALPALLSFRNWNPKRTGITGTLSSSDVKMVPHKPLPTIAAACAASTGLRLLPTLLTKNAHRPLHMVGSAANRRQEIEKADYKADLSGADSLQRILILDDFLTNGDTLSAIAKAIHSHDETVEVCGIALGKNEGREYASRYGHTISNDDVPREWAAIWDQTK